MHEHNVVGASHVVIAILVAYVSMKAINSLIEYYVRREVRTQLEIHG